MSYQDDIREMQENITKFRSINTSNNVPLQRVQYNESTPGYQGLGWSRYSPKDIEYHLKWKEGDWGSTLFAERSN